LPEHPLQVWIRGSLIDSQAPQLRQTWDVLRRVILPGTMESGDLGVQLQTVRDGIPLRVIMASPWVAIGAGEPESSIDVEGR
jgi:hypothetical protein